MAGYSHAWTPQQQRAAYLTRRQFFSKSAGGVGVAALASLLGRDALGGPGTAGMRAGSTNPGAGGLPELPHFAPKAKRVIYLLQNGAPPHVDMFDWKPGLEALRGKEIPESVHKNQRLSTMTSGQKQKLVLPSVAPFQQRGQSGAWVSDFLPHMASVADELCFIKSMHTSAVNHAPAITFFLTGAEQPGRPSMGAWATYGLGSETEELPAFVVMTSRDKEAFSSLPNSCAREAGVNAGASPASALRRFSTEDRANCVAARRGGEQARNRTRRS